jgi:flagellar motor protein MotB
MLTSLVRAADVQIDVAFQELGVFPASTTQIPLDSNAPMPFRSAQAIENVKRNAALGRIASPAEDSLAASSEETDLTTLQNQLREALHHEIALHEVTLHRDMDGLVISLQEFGFFDSASRRKGFRPRAMRNFIRLPAIS